MIFVQYLENKNRKTLLLEEFRFTLIRVGMNKILSKIKKHTFDDIVQMECAEWMELDQTLALTEVITIVSLSERMLSKLELLIS